MSAFERRRCQSCNAEVIWCVTHKGKRMPVDAEPVEGGNVRLRLDGERVIAEYPGKEHPEFFEEDRARYVSHFSSCPHSAQWRRS